MSEQDRARAAFDKLRRDVAPLVARPGVEAVYRTVRHRRQRAAAVAAVVAVMAFAGSFTLVRTSATPSPGASASPEVSATWSPEPTQSPPATQTPQPAASSTAQEPACSSGGRPEFDTVGGGKFTFDVSMNPKPCAGVTVKITWATYTEEHAGQQDATMNLFESGAAYLNEDKPSTRLRISPPANCRLLVVVYGNVAIPPSYSSYTAVFGGPDTLALVNSCQPG